MQINLIKEICEFFKNIPYKDETIVDFDYKLDNILFKNGEDEIFAIVDFEYSHKTIPQLDVIKSARFFARTEDETKLDFDMFNKFINAYLNINSLPINKHNIYCMLMFLVIRRLTYALQYYYYHTKNEIEYKNLAEKDLELVKFIYNNKNKFYL